MKLPTEAPILFQCIVPKTVSMLNLEATNFIRQKPATAFCHIRFSRPMVEGDHVDIKVWFHGSPRTDGQCLLSITPPKLLKSRAKKIIRQNPFVIDPTTSWISNLKDDSTKDWLKFGLKYNNNTIQIRLPGETEFFTFYHVPDPNDPICIDIFFCESVKIISLFDPIESYNTNGIPLLYEKRSSVMVV